jgi:hypothetical protein
LRDTKEIVPEQVPILPWRQQLVRWIEAHPDDALAVSVLGMIDATLGQKEGAIEQARRAAELLPVSRDALDGPQLIVNLATVYAWTNQPDLALQELAASAKTPGGVTYGDLKLNPAWDPIRQDPRFEKLVTALAPPSASTNAPEKSVAVLPFESLSDNKSDAYFADGVQDEILSNLAKVSELKVISRTSVMTYRPGTSRNLRSIAEALAVAHVVEGTVRR